MSLRVAFKRRFPRLHALLVPMYWVGVRPALRPLLEFQLARAFEAVERDPEWRNVAELTGGEIAARLSPRDRYAGVTRRQADHYAKVGYSALRCITAVMKGAGVGAPRSILDLPCGHGRVLRAMKAAFRDAAVTACDLDRGMVDFCAEWLDATGVYSKDSPSHIELDERFDLIWCGSLMTHLDIGRWTEFLEFFQSRLRPQGILVFTTHGERVAQRIETGEFSYGLDAAARHRLMRDYQESGFGFAHYPRTEGYYGVSLAHCNRVKEQIASLPALQLVAHISHGWDDHQDVFGCQRPADRPPR